MSERCLAACVMRQLALHSNPARPEMVCMLLWTPSCTQSWILDEICLSLLISSSSNVPVVSFAWVILGQANSGRATSIDNTQNVGYQYLSSCSQIMHAGPGDNS